MANVKHSALTGTDLHEPKGIASAAVDSVYVANGSASGSWMKQPGSTYGRATFSNNTTETTISAVNTWTIVNPTTYSATTISNMTFSTDKFILNTKGVYQVTITITFKAATAGKNFAFTIGDGTATPVSGAATLTTYAASTLQAVTGFGILELDASDEANVLVMNKTDDVNCTINDVLFTITLLKETT